MAAEARGRYSEETKEPPMQYFTRATQLLRRNGPGDGVEAEKLLLPIVDGEADAALKGRACYALGYRHESCGGSEQEAEAWLAKAAAFGDAHRVKAFCLNNEGDCAVDQTPETKRISFVLEQYRVVPEKLKRTPAFVIAPSTTEQALLPLLASLRPLGPGLQDAYLWVRRRWLSGGHM